MICTRCKQEISFNQWHSDRCPTGWLGPEPYHLIKSEQSIRKAYSQMLIEAAHARTQP